MRRRRVVLVALGCMGWAGVCAGQAATQTGDAKPAHLGKVDFKTSCTEAVQGTLERGVALMHSFQYQEARQAFDEAAAKEPNCAMAYWGQAMSKDEQLWELPNKRALKEGGKEIEQAQKLHPGTAKEQGFVTAAAAYYQKGKMSYTERTTAYSELLEKLHGQMPEDVEVGAFYALSLVSLAELNGVDSLANEEKAIGILQPLLQKYPDHPGVAHYLIHAADRPELAAEGLEAARRYAAIAPDSPHALHMPSHIFVRLGLWQDAIDSNIAAAASAARLAQEHKAESHYQTHAMDFLNYSYLQSGQEAKAREVIAQMNDVVGASEENKAEHRAWLEARTCMELHRWKEAAALQDPPVRMDMQDSTRWARAIGAARMGDVDGAEAAVNQLKDSVAEREWRARKAGYSVSPDEATDLREAEAWLLFAKGEKEEALKEIRAAAERQDASGGESVGVPAREMLADMLMELKRPKEALEEYRTVLKNAPNRFDALVGAARAAHAIGDKRGAESSYTKLTEICPPGADRPELAEAKADGRSAASGGN
jgi:tetratricopeptide (TPR) repeat protein